MGQSTVRFNKDKICDLAFSECAFTYFCIYETFECSRYSKRFNYSISIITICGLREGVQGHHEPREMNGGGGLEDISRGKETVLPRACRSFC